MFQWYGENALLEENTQITLVRETQVRHLSAAFTAQFHFGNLYHTHIIDVKKKKKKGRLHTETNRF